MKATDKLLRYYDGDKDKAIKALGVNPETFRLWMRDGIPLARSLFIEEKTGGHVKAEDVVNDARQAA